MAIAMAQAGGLMIHKNISIADQADAVRAVKSLNPAWWCSGDYRPAKTLSDALELMQGYRISGIPVVEPDSQRLVGILTRDTRFAEQPGKRCKR